MIIEDGILLDLNELCPNLVFPRHMTAISDDMYESIFLTDEIETITVEEGNPVYHSAGNCLIETATCTVVLGCKNSVIPIDGSVKKIGDMAFNACTQLKNIEIPEGITRIGYLTFGFTGLEEIVIPESVNEIGAMCFALNQQLKRIVIKGENVSFGKMAFATKNEVKKYNRPMLIPENKANSFTIIAPKNSTAFEYAKEYEIEFEEIKY